MEQRLKKENWQLKVFCITFVLAITGLIVVLIMMHSDIGSERKKKIAAFDSIQKSALKKDSMYQRLFDDQEKKIDSIIEIHARRDSLFEKKYSKLLSEYKHLRNEFQKNRSTIPYLPEY